MRFHPLLLIVLAGAFVLGRGNDLLMAALALSLHEISHAIVAAAFGCDILSIELLPFGGAARIRHIRLSPYAEFCISAAGPISSLLLAGMTAACSYFFPDTAYMLRAFLAFNLTLFAVNVLPALPLDGGRMLRCLLQKRVSYGRATRLAATLGVSAGAAMLLASAALAYQQTYQLTLPVMGAFLLLSALREIKSGPEGQLSAFLEKNAGLRSGDCIGIQCLAAHESMTAGEALRVLRSNRFTVLRVVDGSMKTLGEVDECQLITGIARGGERMTMGGILGFDRNAPMC